MINMNILPLRHSIPPNYVIVWVYIHVSLNIQVAQPSLDKTASLLISGKIEKTASLAGDVMLWALSGGMAVAPHRGIWII